MNDESQGDLYKTCHIFLIGKENVQWKWKDM